MAGEDSRDLAQPGYQGVRAYLTSRHIPVISARSHAEATGRGDLHPGKWKRGCFATLFQALRQKGVGVSCVWSFGDKDHDTSALEANRRSVRSRCSKGHLRDS
uniref:Uncharacterized protein n=1 Tax=Vitrella brassicaformis TaxID=1169539 RepID=A0A7S1P9E9_9ALVE|mmetsp:Transcript_44410/g.110571  ORF Transcript_44410/g.110571 Transcript_44410/m.110571 type:complete len:103 (+) Transcript_44410:92-400(+)